MSTESLLLEDTETVADLSVFLTRARAVEDGAALIEASGNTLAVYVPVLYPENIGEAVPTIIGMRAMALAESSKVSGLFALGALTDRLARMTSVNETRMEVPPAEVAASWAGQRVPRGGWTPVGKLSVEELKTAADAGMEAVSKALPENAGKPVLRTVRSRIWSSPLDARAADIPTGMAFAAQALGFLGEGGEIVVFESGRWLRISCSGGHVIARRASIF